MTTTRTDVDYGGEATGTPAGAWTQLWQRLRRKKLAMIGLVIIVIIYTFGIGANWLAPYSFTEQDLLRGLEGPTSDHWLGTDRLGRDMLSRAIYSARTTVIITALVIVTGGLIIGPTLGLIAGYRGGRTDGVIGRVGDVFISLPGLPMLILINASLSPRVVEATKWLEANSFLSGLVENGVPSYFTVFGALSLFFWVGSMRIIRAQVLQIRERDFVTASVAMGATTSHIIYRHLLPNVSFLLILGASTALGSVAGSELLLTWFGVGVQPPVPSFGVMIFEAGSVRTFSAHPHLLIVPSMFVVALLYAFALFGDALNDAVRGR
ncbi:MAG: ABC transporter permease [Chloroflexota bacterium]|nr:ABC transporter permease [Chloroflexota bacterium]MDE2696901.1 ABC transporter permease [Chloroflexota bacterium]MXZ47404.1 ABC transporter permease [Chloroflexota bacterium]MXZ62324.1 ABC transporter permease [Chloroflexota bacterium]MYE31682.1 ABC transporter permease [Chloroflexota bacterium]